MKNIYLNADVSSFLQSNGITNCNFDQYHKGGSELGSLVESCVKLTKKLVYGAIKTNILNVRDFEIIIFKTKSLLNKRPIAYKELLRNSDPNEIPVVITPELLIYGGVIPSINITSNYDLNDLDYCSDNKNKINNAFKNIQNVKTRLYKLYNDEFISNLMKLSTNKNSRYKPVMHKNLQVGDVILLKENNTKCINYPLAVITKLDKNIYGEVTGVIARKGKNGELVKRHVTTVIPILSNNLYPIHKKADDHINVTRPKRKAAIISEKLTKELLQNW